MTSMCKMVEELVKETREETRTEDRYTMIAALLRGSTEEELLHHDRFKYLYITQAEIDAARDWERDRRKAEEEVLPSETDPAMEYAS